MNREKWQSDQKHMSGYATYQDGRGHDKSQPAVWRFGGLVIVDDLNMVDK
jgi:hypothetical protein